MQVRKILWLSLFTSTFFYLVVVQLVAPPAASAGEDSTMMTIVFAAVAISCAALSFILPAKITRDALLGLQLPTEASPSFGDLPGGTRIFSDASQARTRAAAALQVGFILRLALREAIALFGFVLAFMGHPLPVYIGFFVLSWALFLHGFPRSAAEDAEIERAYGAKLVTTRERS